MQGHEFVEEQDLELDDGAPGEADEPDVSEGKLQVPPLGSKIDGFDYYDVHPARGAVARVHVEWRIQKWNPNDLPPGIDQEDLQKKRFTQKEYADGSVEVEEDEWGATPRNERVTKRNKKAWRGTTWFFLRGVEDPRPAPTGKRYRHKGPPLVR